MHLECENKSFCDLGESTYKIYIKEMKRYKN